jgi:Ni,Fe-hydrogenase I cytochrome b subunit
MNRRRLAFWVLLLGLIAILATGFYLGATHQARHPGDDGAPAAGPQG